MENDERGIDKLELRVILEDFAKHSFLDSTRDRFQNLKFIKNKADYEKRKVSVERYLSEIAPYSPLSAYKIEKADIAAERIFRINGQLEKSDIKCVSSALSFICILNKSNRNYIKDIFELDLDTSVTQKTAVEMSRLIDDEGEIISNASPELARIRREKDSLLNRQQKIINQTIKTYEKMLMEDKVTLLDNRIVLQVDMHQKNNVKGVLHAYSNSKKTAFIEPEELVLFNNQITELEQDEVVEIQRILESYRERLVSDESAKTVLTKLICELDFINAIAVYMENKKAGFAFLSNEINLKRCYHPIIKKTKLDKAVPISLSLEKNSSLMITGPNMGGKTALLKTIGLACLTVKSGLPIIADEGSTVVLFDRILADIGDDQSIEDGISTFASHIINYKRFLDEAGENTLVLLDEIGTGTSIKEGSAFAITLIKELIGKKAVCVFTSHFDSIKEYALSRPDIKRASMKYDYANNTPYFQIVMDSVGDSGVFNLLKKYGFSDKLIDEAKSLIDTDYVNYSELVDKYKNKINAAEEKMKTLELREKAMAKIENILNYQREQAKIKMDSIDSKYASRKDEELDRLRKDFELIVKQIRESGASKEKIKEMSGFLKKEEEKSNLNAKKYKKEKPVEGDKTFKEGDFVVLASNVEGTIEKISNEKVSVSVNGVLINTRLANIVGKAHKTLNDELRISYSSELITNEIDIRGMYPDDAIEAVEKFLMRAAHENLHEVVIIHGHGTGVLKREVRNYLKRQKDIKSFDSGREMSGGDGVTVVKL